MTFKENLLEKIFSKISQINEPRILDMGSGRSKNILRFLSQNPKLHYVGIEPNKADANFARDLLKQYTNATIINQLGYNPIENFGQFDVCMSLSVLEHVKELKTFLTNSVKAVKSGGLIVHLYDLGHSLYATSLKERLQVSLSNNFVDLLPESKVARYVNLEQVSQMLLGQGAEVREVTYHQMRSHKDFLMFLKLTLTKKKFWPEKFLNGNLKFLNI
ncbi:class I SAM-dependent methyltransferase [Patescibacteria group bacterium]|nr:class I SAM-dependent methyltransferase [Patescibacteria group bacterium]MBU1613499.1 class I SAM-dependent methyltransferase [Patescibacteria group bacterium]